MIEPFFVGPRQVFACYQPASDLSASELMVICPPLFDEYRRSYRALSELASACASAGKHVIRFDYSGTGESAGQASEFSAADWIDDIHRVIDEGLALTGAQTVVLVGVRFGATLASQCDHPAISRLVFWDPVATGRDYIKWLDEVDATIRARHRALAKEVNRRFENIVYECFELGDSLKQSLATLMLDNNPANHPVNVVTTNKQLAEQHAFTGFEYDWPDYHDGNLHPKPVLELLARMVIKQ